MNNQNNEGNVDNSSSKWRLAVRTGVRRQFGWRRAKRGFHDVGEQCSSERLGRVGLRE